MSNNPMLALEAALGFTFVQENKTQRAKGRSARKATKANYKKTLARKKNKAARRARRINRRNGG